MPHHITRRTFLGTAASGGAAALLSGGLLVVQSNSVCGDTAFPWNEATIPQLQSAVASGELTSRDLTKGYLERIAALNPLLHAVIETNPNAVSNRRPSR